MSEEYHCNTTDYLPWTWATLESLAQPALVISKTLSSSSNLDKSLRDFTTFSGLETSQSAADEANMTHSTALGFRHHHTKSVCVAGVCSSHVVEHHAMTVTLPEVESDTVLHAELCSEVKTLTLTLNPTTLKLKALQKCTHLVDASSSGLLQSMEMRSATNSAGLMLLPHRWPRFSKYETTSEAGPKNLVGPKSKEQACEVADALFCRYACR